MHLKLHFALFLVFIITVAQVNASPNKSAALAAALESGEDNSSLVHDFQNDDISIKTVYEVDTYSPIFIFMCIVYTISTLSAIGTNFIVLLVYLLGHSAKTDLSKFLINLAIADFLMSTVCMPFSFVTALLKRWIFGEILCPIVLFKQVFAVSLSIYTMVAIGIDRYAE